VEQNDDNDSDNDDDDDVTYFHKKVFVHDQACECSNSELDLFLHTADSDFYGKRCVVGIPSDHVRDERFTDRVRNQCYGRRLHRLCKQHVVRSNYDYETRRHESRSERSYSYMLNKSVSR